MRVTLCVCLLIAALASSATAHGSVYRGPAGDVPPNMRRPEDPPPPPGWTEMPDEGPSWWTWWSLNKEEFLYAGVREADLLAPDRSRIRRDILPALLRLSDAGLTDPERARTLLAVAALASGETPGPVIVERLLRRLVPDGGESDIVRMTSAVALGILPSPGAASQMVLARVLRSTGMPGDVRSAAALGLGLMGRDATGVTRQRCARTLRAVLDEGKIGPEVSAVVARSLGLLGDPRLVPDLLERLGRADDGVLRAGLVAAIGSIATGRPEAARTRVVTALRDALLDDEVRCRRAAAIGMGQVGRHGRLESSLRIAAIDALRGLLREPDVDPATACYALTSLGRLGGAARAVEPRVAVRLVLAAELSGQNVSRARFAALGLGLLGRGPDLSPPEREVLVALLGAAIADGAGAAIARSPAAVALGLCGDRQSTGALEAMVRMTGIPDRTRAAAAVGLGLLGGPSARRALLPALDRKQPFELRIQAALSAGLLGETEAAPRLLGKTRAAGDPVAVRALGKLGDRRALAPLLAITRNGKLGGDWRSAAAIAIADLFDRADRLVLTNLTRDLDFATPGGVFEKLLSVY